VKRFRHAFKGRRRGSIGGSGKDEISVKAEKKKEDWNLEYRCVLYGKISAAGTRSGTIGRSDKRSKKENGKDIQTNEERTKYIEIDFLPQK